MADFTALDRWNQTCGELLEMGAELWERLNAERPMLGGGVRYQPTFQRTSKLRTPRHEG